MTTSQVMLGNGVYHATVLTPAQYAVFSWRNGLGETTQLAIYPPGADFTRGDPFVWRVSSAPVNADGPFSRFPGYDRLLLLLTGGGIELTRRGETGEETQVLRHPLESCRFSGDLETSGRLLSGPITDFNVMTARGKVRADVDTCQPSTHQGSELTLEANFYFFTAFKESSGPP